MSIQQLIEKQGWERKKKKDIKDLLVYDKDILVYEFEEDPDTLKIFFIDNNTRLNELKKLKNRLWNTYYSKVLIYKNSPNNYKIWTNNQHPESGGKDLKEKFFDEKTSPIEYWDRYITKTPKNTVDKKLEESILAVFQKLKEKYSQKLDDLISIILACTFIRFLEDRDLADVQTELIDELRSKEAAIDLFKKYNELHNGFLFKKTTLYSLDKKTCQILKDFLENDLFNQGSLFRFDFKYIPIELISNIYEKLLTEKLGIKGKRSQGVAYTPPKLASYLTKEAFKQLDKKLNKQKFSKIKIGDLSTGSGIFLVLSFRELLKRLSKKSFKEKEKILKKVFYGIDSDASAINITIFSLYIELLEDENKKLSSNNKFPILKNIKVKDTLTYSDNNNFFDLVIGNPPWKSRDKDSFNKIKHRKFSKDIGNKELAQIFIHIGLEKLKDKGILAMVLPTAIFYNKTSFNFRNSILENTILKEFVDFSPIRNHVFKNHVEASVLIGEKKTENTHSYVIPMRRVINEADYLYFNHVSGNTSNIDSKFLQSRDDSWQIAIRGGNLATLFINRLSADFMQLNKINKYCKKEVKIGTGYQSKKTGNKITVSDNYSNKFSKELFLLVEGKVVKKYTNLRKAGKSHILFDPKFYNNCIVVANSYKYQKGLIIKYFKANKNRVISGDFNIIYTEDKNLLHFISALLKSRLGEFLINIRGAKTSLIERERQNPKIQKIDIEKILVPIDYARYQDIIDLGQKLIKNDFKNVPQRSIDKKVENIYKINRLERELIKQWEKMTKRREIDSDNVKKGYRKGFEHMLNSYNLPKPKKWGYKVIKGVEIISFSENDTLPQENNRIKKKINDVVIAKNNMGFEFITNNQGIIVRRKENNYGFLTGLLDVELILSSL